MLKGDPAQRVDYNTYTGPGNESQAIHPIAQRLALQAAKDASPGSHDTLDKDPEWANKWAQVARPESEGGPDWFQQQKRMREQEDWEEFVNRTLGEEGWTAVSNAIERGAAGDDLAQTHAPSWQEEMN